MLDLLESTPGPQAEPTAFRLGKAVLLPDGEITANIRLLRGRASSEGEMYMRREGNRWLVADVQANPSALAVIREQPAERFFPSPYRWMLAGDASGAQ